MHILFLSRWFPFPPNNGSKLRISNLLRGLSQHHEITLISFSDQPEIDRTNNEVRAICRETLTLPWKPYNPKSLNARLGYFNLAPRSIIDTYSKEMGNTITRILEAGHFDILIASEITMASYASYFQAIPSIFEEIELGVPYEAVKHPNSFRHRIRNSITWYKQRQYLSKLLQNFFAITVVSEQERQIFCETFPGYKNIHIIPNCLDFREYEHVRENPIPDSIIFTGSFRYSANYDAMLWFLRDVFPRVRSKIPNVSLKITGDNENKPLPNLENVILTGFVDDIMPLISQSWCSIAPLRVGGGTRLKILESMALRTPVIATSKGAEGLGLENGKHLLIADSPEQFSDCLISVLENPNLRKYLVDNASKAAKGKFDCSQVITQFLQIISDVIHN